MKITIFAAGSRGDVQPCVALAHGLQQAGYGVRLAAPEDFAAFVRAQSVEFWALRGDVQQIMASDEGRKFMQSAGANPIKSMRSVRKLVAPVVTGMAEDAFAACRDADALICLGVLGAFGQTIAEALRLPVLNIEPTPLLPTKAFPAPSWPIQKNWGGLHNSLSGLLMFEAIWLWYRPFVDAFRRSLGLGAYGPARFYRAFHTTPMLGLYSPTVIPHPRDWPDSVHVTGYLFLDAAAGWQPPPALEGFLAAGAPPVYIGFGSMAGNDPQQLADLVLAALVKSGQRGLLLTGWGGLRAGSTPANVFVLESAPHNWLFPRMAAVVHHGGAGTTGEGLRAGVPSILVPFVLDQPFWGERVRALGLGPAPIPRKQLTVDLLAGAITGAVTDTAMQRRAALAGAAIRAEDGIGNAVKHIEHVFGAARRGG